MKVLIYILEWFISFFVIGGLYFLIAYFLKKQVNQITAAIFGFAFVSIFVFLIAPYVISFPNPTVVYTPSLIFWFVYFLYKANKEMK